MSENGAASAAIQPADGKKYADHRAVFKQALYTDLAMLVLSGVRHQGQLRQRLGISDSYLREALDSPEFQAIYDDIAARHRNDCMELARDEKMDPAVRARATRTKGQTLLAEAVALLERRIKENTSSDPEALGVTAAELRTALHASKLAFDEAVRGEPDQQRTSKHLHLHFKPTDAQRAVFREAVADVAGDAPEVIEVPNAQSSSTDDTRRGSKEDGPDEG